MIRVAGYCRVSTEKEDQVNSIESQKRFFREYIESHPDWELYAIYADEGMTGSFRLHSFSGDQSQALPKKFSTVVNTVLFQPYSIGDIEYPLP